MWIDVSEEDFKELLDCLKNSSYRKEKLGFLTSIFESFLDKKKREKEFDFQEVWIKCFYNGYFYLFKDMKIIFNIEVSNVDYPKNSLCYRGSTVILPAINEEDGRIDLTTLLHTFLLNIKENPDSTVKAYACCFGRDFHFKNLNIM